MEHIRQKLIECGLLDPAACITLEPAGTGLNNMVFVVITEDRDERLTVRLRRPGDHTLAEAEALESLTDCSGVPRLRALTDTFIVLDYIHGAPGDFQSASAQQCASLMDLLACVHRRSYAGYHPWPRYDTQPGTRADLFRFRCASLAQYASFDRLVRQRPTSEQANLVGLLQSLSLSDPGWSAASFSRLHGDLSQGNILWQENSAGLIDWEYSRIGDPAEDLAYLIVEQPIDAERRSNLFRYYSRSGGTDDVSDRLFSYAILVSLDSALWWSDYGAARDLDVCEEVQRRIQSAREWAILLGRASGSTC